MSKGYIIDWTTIDEDNADLQKKNFPMSTVKNLQMAVKMFLEIGETEMATSIFDAIKMFFKKNTAQFAA